MEEIGIVGVGPSASTCTGPEVVSMGAADEERKTRGEPDIVGAEEIGLTVGTSETDLGYEEKPMCIIDRQVRQLRNKSIPMIKVEWKEHHGKDATWEMEEEMRIRHPELFPEQGP
ncbi:uncharacterized protein LOC114306752 [Camellia sinensis]|uniref:uncharacterized protein LOC114306752 n=1 Tax=Camellia sinensis TaxID=4442 RepID=UPI0010369535|nr:uncharacterized protein LOC114306752 [Camellia sinensis]